MDGHGGSSAGSYLADPTSPIPSHCASIVATSTVRVNTTTLSALRLMTIMNDDNDDVITIAKNSQHTSLRCRRGGRTAAAVVV